MKKSSVIGACVLAAAVVLSVPLGVHTSLTSLREEANSSYYYDKTGFAIWEGVENREAAASNMITVAERYTDDNPAWWGIWSTRWSTRKTAGTATRAWPRPTR